MFFFFLDATDWFTSPSFFSKAEDKLDMEFQASLQDRCVQKGIQLYQMGIPCWISISALHSLELIDDQITSVYRDIFGIFTSSWVDLFWFLGINFWISHHGSYHIAIIKEIPGLRPCFDLLAFRTPARVSGAVLLRLLGQKRLSGKPKSRVSDQAFRKNLTHIHLGLPHLQSQVCQ